MWKALLNLTKIRVRAANTIGAFGLVVDPLPFPTKASFWLHRRPRAPLPIITGRGVKYTHNDINDTVLHPDSGPTGMGLVHPERHQPLEVDPPHDQQSTPGQEPAVLTPRPRHRLATTVNTVAKQTNLVMIS